MREFIKSLQPEDGMDEQYQAGFNDCKTIIEMKYRDMDTKYNAVEPAEFPEDWNKMDHYEQRKYLGTGTILRRNKPAKNRKGEITLTEGKDYTTISQYTPKHIYSMNIRFINDRGKVSVLESLEPNWSVKKLVLNESYINHQEGE